MGIREAEHDKLLAIRKTLLRHHLRKKIFEVVRSRPGLNRSQLARRADIERSLAIYHLESLLEESLLVLRDLPHTNEKVCFHPEDLDLWQNERTRILFGHDRLVNIALNLVGKEGATTEAIREDLDITADTIRYHLRQLKGAELVDCFRMGNNHIYLASDELENWLDRALDRGLKNSSDG